MMIKAYSLMLAIMVGSLSALANGTPIKGGLWEAGSVGPRVYRGTFDFVQVSRNTVAGKSSYSTAAPTGAVNGVAPKPDSSSSLPSLTKLFAISLLWIPFNRWKKKH